MCVFVLCLCSLWMYNGAKSVHYMQLQGETSTASDMFHCAFILSPLLISVAGSIYKNMQKGKAATIYHNTFLNVFLWISPALLDRVQTDGRKLKSPTNFEGFF